ncbi:hypothetical protein [Mycobacterium sp.]|nr:hypothetical protein [Mycobacterium sp.]HTY31501.1 hypothetical protein [Mycobacterium sp.]
MTAPPWWRAAPSCAFPRPLPSTTQWPVPDACCGRRLAKRIQMLDEEIA